MANLTKDETDKLERLKEDLSKDPIKASAEQFSKATNIKETIRILTNIENLITNEALSQVFAMDRDAKIKRKAASIAAQNTFSNEKLQGVGAEVWRELWEAARRYSIQIAYCNQPFPPTHDESLCVLCQKPLGDEGRERMCRFEKYVQDDTECHAREAEMLACSKLEIVTSLEISTRSLAPYLREVAIQNPLLLKDVRRFLASARQRRCVLLKALTNKEEALVLPIPYPNPKAGLTQLELGIRAYGVELQQAAAGEARIKLQNEFEELSDKNTLHGVLQNVQEEIGRLNKIHSLDKCIAETKTHAITKLGSEIAKIVITQTLQEQFKEEIIKLAADRVKVEIVQSGGRAGSPHYQVRFIGKPKAMVGKILSEGERSCVALAAFMTELAIAPHNSTLVFDDPISSLDHRYREKVARRLIEEAERRQIIVFTHDLVFFHDLCHWASINEQKTTCISLSRNPEGTGVVCQEVPWIAQKIEERIKTLKKSAAEGKSLYDASEVEKYKHTAFQFYNNLRACWENAIETVVFGGVILRYREQIKTDRLKNVISLTEKERTTLRNGFIKCSNVTDAHDRSMARNAAVPPPDELLNDVNELENWINVIKSRPKAGSEVPL